MSSNQDSPVKLKRKVHFSAVLPPSLICLGAISAGIILHEVWPLGVLQQLVLLRLIIGIAFVLVGIVLTVSSIRAFRHAGEKTSQRASTVKIVQTGPYRVSRNPMYVAYVIISMGIAIVLGNGWIMFLMVPAILLIHAGVVRREEHYLRAKFGDEFKRYRLQVRRWL